MKDERCSINNIFRKQIFDAIKVLRKDKRKLQDCKTIHSYITQHNATNLEGNLFKNTPVKEGDSYYEVSEDSGTTFIFDNNNTKSNPQEQTLSNEEIPKLGETSTLNLRNVKVWKR